MYCSYTISHPNEDKMMVRIQAREGRAVDILRRGLENLNDVCDHTIDTFEQAMKDFRESTWNISNIFIVLNCYLWKKKILTYFHPEIKKI